MKRLRLPQLVTAALLALGIWHLGGAGLIHAKAWAAPLLIERAWVRTLDTRVPVKPWPWADTWPVAKLAVPAQDIERYVLAGANGGSLPFGPGHLEGSALPGEPGSMVIAGHVDTHFGFLQTIRPGAMLVLTSMYGRRYEFEVINQEIVDARLYGISPLTTGSELILVTCQPTEWLPIRGPYRLIVTARPVERSSPAELPAGPAVHDHLALLTAARLY